MTHNPLTNPYGYLPPGYQGNIAPNQSQFYPNYTPTQPQSAQAMSAPLQISCVVPAPLVIQWDATPQK